MKAHQHSANAAARGPRLLGSARRARTDWQTTRQFTQPVGVAHGLETYRATTRSWGGFTVREAAFSGSQGLTLEGPYRDSIRVQCLLDAVGGRAEFSEKPGQLDRASHTPRTVSFVPAGASLRCYSETGGHFGVVMLSIALQQLDPELQHEFQAARLREPRFMFTNQRIWQMGRKLASECMEPVLFSPLYCDHLAALLLLELARSTVDGPRTPAMQGGLTHSQLSRTREFIEENPSERVRLSDLAQLAGVSVSHFCHAFKQSTGMSPYRWQLLSRIRKAQELLLSGSVPLASIALATGFADQSHFTRTFRRIVGKTPGAWLRANRS